MTATVSVPWLDDAIAELEEDGFLPHQPETRPAQPSWDNPPWNPTHVTDRVLDYVTREFNEGVAGNRDSLPSTYDVARACIRGAGNTKSCRLAMRHLRLLELVGEIIRIHDPKSDTPVRHGTYWALPNSDRETSEAKPEPETVPVNRFGFTDERWAAMKPWQRNAIRSIELAETEPSSW
ncbi:hypothetical protein Sipo8835_32635 [Streptomyces ipomoeae]|uniref:Uncharacterized protein n=1 Tax=Streptomyces ipomoeae TaxID=103232 RepID=A0AAE8VWT0_9ACTN|nr:hypothetical protein [Streptomyces ipomoeae]TQE24862.1 hypothetical protein Sipo8835_32635 [Streptomyces ipomoeae]